MSSKEFGHARRRKIWGLGVVVITLVISTAQLARAQDSTIAFSYSSLFLGNFTQIKIVEVSGLGLGDYIINAKTAMHNLDSSPQAGSCQLIAKDTGVDPPIVLDKTTVRLTDRGSGDQVSIALQAALCTGDVSGGFSVEVDCGTFNGSVNETVLTVTKVTQVQAQTGPVSRFSRCSPAKPN